MTAILYPVAETAEAALHVPRGYAAREREAQSLAAGPVAFVSEVVGPAFAAREAAMDAYAGRVEDERPGAPSVPPESRWRRLVPVCPETGIYRAVMFPAQPSYRDGRRWPVPEDTLPILWRLSVSYWKIAAAADLQGEAARKLRRDDAGRGLSGPALNALARQPLRPVRLQQPLDVGLFEMRPPEAPNTLIPDE